MVSDVTICNAALRLLGGERITALDDGSRNADLCQDAYAECRDEQLRGHTWNFAVKRQKLAQSTTEPVFGFGYAYALPADWLRTVSVHGTELGRNTTRYRVEGKTIVADMPDIWLRYIYQVTDEAKMTADFRLALAARLAVELALPITQSNTMLENMVALHRRRLTSAKGKDGVEDQADQLPETSWVTARRGRYGQGRSY